MLDASEDTVMGDKHPGVKLCVECDLTWRQEMWVGFSVWHESPLRDNMPVWLGLASGFYLHDRSEHLKKKHTFYILVKELQQIYVTHIPQLNSISWWAFGYDG